MAVTTRGIVTPDGTEDWDLVVDLNAMADSIDDALDTIDTDLGNDFTAFAATRQIQTYKWANAAARTAQAGMSEGDVGDQADTDQRWRYSGAAWVNITNGLFPVVPTSVVNATLSASGKVTASAVSSFSVNGCFTAAYENYLIKFDLTTAAAGALSGLLRASGTDSTTGYDSQRLTASSTATPSAAQSLNIGSWPLTVAGLASRGVGNLELFSPMQAASTAGMVSAGQTPNPMTTAAVLISSLIQHRPSTAYDGLTITASTGAMTGSIRIYGFNNN